MNWTFLFSVAFLFIVSNENFADGIIEHSSWTEADIHRTEFIFSTFNDKFQKKLSAEGIVVTAQGRVSQSKVPSKEFKNELLFINEEIANTKENNLITLFVILAWKWLALEYSILFINASRQYQNNAYVNVVKNANLAKYLASFGMLIDAENIINEITKKLPRSRLRETFGSLLNTHLKVIERYVKERLYVLDYIINGFRVSKEIGSRVKKSRPLKQYLNMTKEDQLATFLDYVNDFFAKLFYGEDRLATFLDYINDFFAKLFYGENRPKLNPDSLESLNLELVLSAGVIFALDPEPGYSKIYRILKTMEMHKAKVLIPSTGKCDGTPRKPNVLVVKRDDSNREYFTLL